MISQLRPCQAESRRLGPPGERLNGHLASVARQGVGRHHVPTRKRHCPGDALRRACRIGRKPSTSVRESSILRCEAPAPRGTRQLIFSFSDLFVKNLKTPTEIT